MTLWEQYNPHRMLGGVLGEVTGLPLTQCSEKALFGALKRHLTRKELRSWAMHAGGKSTDEIVQTVGLEASEIDKLVLKAEKKLRQPKLQQEYRQLLAETGDGEE